jgi:hypothetical protein
MEGIRMVVVTKNIDVVQQELPGPVRTLIDNKLKHARREKDADLLSARTNIYNDLNDHVQTILASLGKSDNSDAIKANWTRAFVRIGTKLYRELAETVASETKKWPGTVWETVKPILDKAGIVLNGNDLNAIVDEFSWAIGQTPFIASYVNAEHYKETVYRLIDGYGLRCDGSTSAFNHELTHVASAITVDIMNKARFARAHVSNEIGEYMLEVQNLTTAPAGKREETFTQGNCILNPPKRLDDWFKVIRAMAAEFYQDNNRCPDETEAWDRLRSNPPKTYKISSAKDRGEDSISMGGQTLGKRSFKARWKRYTTDHN